MRGIAQVLGLVAPVAIVIGLYDSDIGIVNLDIDPFAGRRRTSNGWVGRREALTLRGRGDRDDVVSFRLEIVDDDDEVIEHQK